jgi:patatin-like phospholipase/acyl hydrolase
MEAGVRRVSGTPFRILALDGGGMRGIFTASYLAELDRRLGRPLAEDIDLIVGTSTGGIIGLGLAADYPPAEMLEFYLDHGPKIFARSRPFPIWLFRPRYSRSVLDRVLHDRFGEMRMNELRTPVCITAHELVAGTTRVWKDDHHPSLHGGGDQLVWKVAAATAAAPTFFAPMQMEHEDSHVDGGVWANNPALVGITEAIRYFDRQLRDIRLLSVGTTSRVFRIKSHRKAAKMGWVGWARKTLDLLQGTVSMAADRQAMHLLPQGQYLRIDNELAERVRLDNVEACRPLRERGAQEARVSEGDVRAVLGL